MCLLSVYPAGVMPVYQDLVNGMEANSDGSGFAIATSGGNVIVEKAIPECQDTWVTGMSPLYDLARRFIELRERHLDMPAMFHSRFGTSGLWGTYNTHPFTLGADKRTVLAHNGVISQLSHANGKRGREHDSDTRQFAMKVAPERFSYLDSKRTQRKMERYLGSYNKVAFITTNPRYKHNLYMMNGYAGLWDNGAWHSNSDYKTPLFTKGYGYATTGAPGWDWNSPRAGDEEFCGAGALRYKENGDCPFCDSVGSVGQRSRTCLLCYTCMDCEGVVGHDCGCYIPDGEAEWSTDQGGWVTGAEMVKTDIVVPVQAAREPAPEAKPITWQEYLDRRFGPNGPPSEDTAKIMPAGERLALPPAPTPSE